jgi:large subunit ribosomal protein L25
MVIQLKAEPRDENTKAALNELRATGKVPGVVYGKKIETTLISVEKKELLALLRSNPNAIVEMIVPEIGTQPVMIQDIQRDKLYRNLLHIDFQQISMNEPIKATVRLEMTGEPQSLKQGGILQVQLHEIEIKCLPADLPSSISVDLTELNLGDTLLVSDLPLGSGVEARTDLNEVVATILAPQKEETVDAPEEGDPEAGAEKAEAVHNE